MRKVCLDCVYELAQKDPRVVYIGSDLGPGTLDAFKQEMPHRFFMEGVSEAHVVGMAAGLALEGYVPYVHTIATFITRRCYEQVAIDLCLHKLPVRLIGNGGGTVYAPLGPTHLAIEDMAIMRALPNMTVVAVSDEEEMRRFMFETIDYPGPIYIRLGKGNEPVISDPTKVFKIGQAILMRKPGDVLIITTGVMAHAALDALKILKEKNIHCGLLNMHTVKPLDVTFLIELAQQVKCIVTVEEHTLIGGLGSAVLEALYDHFGASMPKLVRLGLPDQFAKEYGSQETMLNSYGLAAENIALKITASLNEKLETIQ